ncbi:MAG: hypothetical protein JNK46_08490 [Methylobacteriaceae bacterium]|nr:hypothetical protein [Methylobacteriaceae bacterium]
MAFERGVRNLLVECAGAQPGERLVIFHEDPALGFYEAGLHDALAEAMSGFGLDVRQMRVDFAPRDPTLSEPVRRALGEADHALFLARLGDQLRFCAMPPGSRPIVSYAVDRRSFASEFAGASYTGFVALKSALNELLAGARHIRVTCPLGTDFSGALPTQESAEPPDVTIQRFPMTVFAPLDARGFAGKVALGPYLLGTGSRYYEPYQLRLEQPVEAHFEAGRLLRFEGPADARRSVEAHYRRVADEFGIDPDVVHSWHAGIHPACAFDGRIEDNFERWSGCAFGNPRILHFHTCGDYAPGEICWNVFDPTILVDGLAIWRNGRIDIDQAPGVAAVLERSPELRALFDRPERRIGLGADG